MLTVIATDVDNGHNGTVAYSLKQVPVKDGTALFAINPNTGLITTTMNNALDRETQPEFKIIVQARDQGTPDARSGRQICKHLFFIIVYISKESLPLSRLIVLATCTVFIP